MTRFRAGLLVAALLAGHIPASFAEPPPPAGARSDDSIEALALQWFAEMQAGQIDRSQLAPTFSAQLPAAEVGEMSRYLKPYGPPAGAAILQTRTIGDQTFYDVKILLRRGDSASLLIGLDPSGKITGIAPASMPGG